MAKKSGKESGRKSKKPAGRSSTTAKRGAKTTATKPSPGREPGPKPMLLQRTMGFLIAATEPDWRPYINAFESELRRNWIVNGHGHGPDTLTIDYQPAAGAAGNPHTLSNVAKTFVNNNVNIIVTSGTQATQTCMNVPSKIPIVFAAAGDLSAAGWWQP